MENDKIKQATTALENQSVMTDPSEPAKVTEGNAAGISEPVVDSASSAPRRFIIGLGASAGGLEALSQLISCLPSDLGASYVVVQHMSPNHRSMLVQLISRETTMPVCEIEQGEKPQPDHIYITPPNRNLAMIDGQFVLSEPAAQAVPKPSINTFFVSLAEERGEDAIAVVLSGTGTDGAVGVRAVKASGGLVFAQDTSTAKYSGMPQAAIETDCVDWVMPPDKIAAEIEIIVRAQGVICLPSADPSELGPTATLRSLLQRVMKHAKVDFSGYKEATVWRRILRRMVSNRVHTLDEYVALADKNPEELNQLAKEILISVTSFFRDPHAFKVLRDKLTDLLEHKTAGEEIRIWVAGCATGEEAYSIAIMLCDILGPSLLTFRIQIFATDIDLNAMSIARRGVYPEGNLSELPEEILQRYFVKRDGVYEISKSVRDLVVFARQDLVQDPPFLRLDLLSCRNVLIYFQSFLQQQVLNTFHYALKPGGILFLGKSETAHQSDGMFASSARDAKLFIRREGEAKLPTQNLTSSSAMIQETPRIQSTRARLTQSKEEVLLKAVVDVAMPASVVVNRHLDVRHVFGNAADFLSIPAGRLDFNLLNLLRAEWKIEAQTLIYKSIQSRTSVSGRIRNTENPLQLIVKPLPMLSGDPENYYLVSFEKVDVRPANVSGSPASTEGEQQNLEEELNATREHLQTVIEELETSNEETQALNEELQASNEELQASNEELQASNEELQSTNEELTTVNEELQIKTAELADANADLENIQNSIGFLILVVNDQMRLVRYNSAAANWLGLGGNALGESLRAVPNLSHYPDLISAVETVFDGQRLVEKQVSHEGRHYFLRAMPRLMSTRESKGAVVTLMEESELIETQQKLRDKEKRLLSIMNYSSTLVAVKDLSGRYEYINPRFSEVFGLNVEEVLGKTDRQLFGEDLAQALRARDIDTLKADSVVEGLETLDINGLKHPFYGIRFPLKAEDGTSYAVCVKLADPSSKQLDL